MVRSRTHRTLFEPAVPVSQEGGPWRTRNLCKLSDHRVSGPFVSRSGLFQRLFGIARLQNLAGERPLLLAEVGLDSQKNGKVGQAQALRWLIQGAFCIGLRWSLRFWVDRRVVPRRIRDSGLGFRPDAPRPARVKPLWKPCARYLGRGRSPAARNWPSISVVVCSYNGHRTIRDTLEGLAS